MFISDSQLLKECLVQSRASLKGREMMDSSYNSPVNGRTIPGAEPEYRRMDSIKMLLVELGSLCGQKTIHFLNSSVNYLEVGHWMRANGFYARNRTNRRRELFDQISARVAEKKVLYLEFGVASGASMRYWSRLLKNPGSQLHGFDTFEGLPSDWRMGDKKGAYSADGQPPQIDDPRVKFFKGLFEQTLPGYAPPVGYDVLIINIDCDLYSSASFVLRSLSEHIRPGTFIYFDEFSDPHNELRAFHDFLVSTGKRFALTGATKAYAQVSFECC